MSDEIEISVLIRTFNSARTLDQLLTRLDLAPSDQVLIVDSGSTDGTLAIAERHGCRIIPAPPPFNYSKSLNLGFRHATNPWVLVISSHCVPAVPDLLHQFRLAALHFPQDVAVGYAASTLSGLNDPALPLDRVSYYDQTTYHDVARVCGNGNSLYRRRAWERLAFDEDARTAEDKIWILEKLRQGQRFAYVPGARGLNRNQASLRYMFNKGRRDARALRPPDHRSMKPWQLAGAWKNLLREHLKGQIDCGNLLRYGAHIFGQFVGSYQSEDNMPVNGGS